MARWGCLGCGTVYRLRISRCPRCHGTKFREGDVALLECASCTTRYAVGLESCPHCGGTEQAEEGSKMPKITRHGGPSSADAGPAGAEPMQDVEAKPDGTEHGLVPDDDEGGEQPSDGSNSSTSPEKPPTSSEQSGSSGRQRARTAGSRSGTARTGSSTASSTGGDGQADATSK